MRHILLLLALGATAYIAWHAASKAQRQRALGFLARHWKVLAVALFGVLLAIQLAAHTASFSIL